jgi:hypothetical protein
MKALISSVFYLGGLSHEPSDGLGKYTFPALQKGVSKGKHIRFTISFIPQMHK